MKTSSIEWCDSTLNLMMGCDGCELASRGGSGTCYAEVLTGRYGGSSKGYPSDFYTPALFPARLAEVARWPDLTGTDRPDKPHMNGLPRHIFHGDMGDYHTESLPLDWLAEHVERIAAIPAIHLFLTKRPARMARFWREYGPVPPNFLLMTSVTNRATLGRIAALRSVPGARLGLSIEPLLEDLGELDLTGIDWVIVGGESGHGARPMHPAWVRSIRDQCVAAGVAFFFKQWGEHGSGCIRMSTGLAAPPREFQNFQHWVDKAQWAHGGVCLDMHGRVLRNGGDMMRARDEGAFPVAVLFREGKKKAGRLLDGREWSEMPERSNRAAESVMG